MYKARAALVDMSACTRLEPETALVSMYKA